MPESQNWVRQGQGPESQIHEEIVKKTDVDGDAGVRFGGADARRFPA